LTKKGKLNSHQHAHHRAYEPKETIGVCELEKLVLTSSSWAINTGNVTLSKKLFEEERRTQTLNLCLSTDEVGPP
jgi:hypothetical protein